MKIKLLINLPTIGDTGLCVAWLNKIKYFQKVGCQVYLNTGINIEKIKNINDIYKFNQDFQKNHSYLKFKNNSKLEYVCLCLKRNFISLLNIKKLKKFNIVYSPSSVLDLILISFLLKKINKKIKWITILDNIVPLNDPGNKITRTFAWIFFQISLLLIKSADHIFVISENLNQFLIKNKFNKHKITVTGNAIENELIKSIPYQTKIIEALFVGRINETKGIYDMLKVLKIIINKYPKFKLFMMGNNDISSKEKFIKKIKVLNLNKNVVFLGYKTGIEKYKIIKQAKTFWFLSVSKSESFGVALLEAVASGIPSFVYDLKVFKKIYKNNEVIFSPIHDTKSVAKKVLNLFKSKKFTNQQGKKLLNKYSWEKIAKIEFKEIKV